MAPPPDDAEPTPAQGENPASFALRAAEAKAYAVFKLCSPKNAAFPFLAERGGREAPSPVLISADTVVVLDGEALGKPRHVEEALGMLRRLSGRAHTVVTGCVVLHDGKTHRFSRSTRVSFWRCPDAALAAYAACGEPMDKAGAYAVQGKGAFLVRHIHGSWTNVVGLPLTDLTDLLLRLGLIAPQ